MKLIILIAISGTFFIAMVVLNILFFRSLNRKSKVKKNGEKTFFDSWKGILLTVGISLCFWILGYTTLFIENKYMDGGIIIFLSICSFIVQSVLIFVLTGNIKVRRSMLPKRYIR